MGCGISKEKVENEMLKTKLERNLIQYERKKQLELLKDIDGLEYKAAFIPDYLDSTPDFTKKTIVRGSKKTISVFNKNNNKKNTNRILRPRRSKSFIVKRKSKKNQIDIFSGQNVIGNKKRKTMKL